MTWPRSAVFLQPMHLELIPGEDTVLSAIVINEQGGPDPAVPTLLSTDPGVATVEPSGLVTAVAVGTATIIGSSPNRTDATVPVVVSQSSLGSR